MAIKTNKTKQELEQSIRVRRDALQTLHQKLKKDSDAFQLWIMGISTLSGSILASVMRFQDYNVQLEALVKSSAELTSVLKGIRDTPNVSIEMVEMYNKSLAIVESVLYPTQRKKYFKLAEAGVVAITTDELLFNKKLDKAEKKHTLIKSDIELGNSNEIIKYEEEEN